MCDFFYVYPLVASHLAESEGSAEKSSFHLQNLDDVRTQQTSIYM